ncbi:laccase domain protein [Paenibacillus cisolokensis]|uniref:Purine nucleoside phosphorylase n=2 Tax=Paenibacillus cisolokensis TaxID=1658519 RepID=A0ABQ4N7M9_9BACL|nr:laccase domain protein [Paenibacillus cisolokensis]
MMEPFRERTSAKGPSLFLLSSWVKQYKGLTAGFTGRNGGVSGPPWNSLNVGLHVGDRPEDAVRNRRIVAEAIGWPFEAWTCAEQVHGDRVHAIGADEKGSGRESTESAIPAADAIMTAEPGVLLVSFYADCVPLYFYDPERGVIALAHAGWKGTALEIASRTVEAMTSVYGSRPSAIRAAIGPSIGGCCYEVDEPVIARMEPLVRSLAGISGISGDRPAIIPTGEGKARLDLKEMNRQIMIKAGIMPIHIEMSQWCTACRTDLFFSFRAEGGRTGRMASWIGIGME